ncbi:Glutamyl-tRNA(Gln) amidotransferase subunit A [BD1-7 clade bacterium]|uniref:Glutamyl-tRNA(Gln) amidotransferase subunit A n=1 Tax=BD1-7 clade bacterium TaxID=2029982 RepID=A0A5S9MVP8_9GAMM|nr:Glutamyl-tRNA(Gln) amidotransferase subunit A [BD1-7 clade bacterium]
MHQKTLTELIQSLQNKDVSSIELTQHYLDRINSLDSSVNSYITVTADRALEQARAADTLLANGEATSPLTGVPLAHKDIFCTDGVRTSAASKMLDNFIAPYNATVIEKFNQAGTVSLGKTNMDEFAMGSSNENSFYGAVKNPWDLERVPGGSSGGSAAAVAAHLAPAATGTDTGGSIRQPAAFCGLTGLKPTYGAVSRYGMIAYASSLDQAGPMARTAEDAALMMNVMAGFDAKDSTSIQREHDNYVADLDKGLDGLKIGMPKEYFSDQLDSNIAAAIDAAVKTYESLGATIQEVTLPQTQNAIPAYYIIAPAEASANLQRFDGVRYGHRCDDPRNLEDLYERTRAEGFGEEVQRRILVGTYALSAGFYDAYYRQAQKIRRLVKNDFNQAFDNVDLILAPTAPSTAFRIGEKSADPVQMYQEDIFTISVNLAGLPAISLPCGEDAGLPIGMQLIGNAFSDSRLLNAAHKYQQATDWHQRVAAFAKQG